MRPLSLLSLLLAAPLCAQTGAVPGLDVRLYDTGAPAVFGRRGAAYPAGEVSMGIGHSHCNAGTVHIPWIGTVSGVMVDTYPRIAYLLTRDSGGRFVQVSSKAHMKHSRTAFNFTNGPCGPCQTGPANTFRIGCYDVYGAGLNGAQGMLGPTDEVDPWLGTWNPIGSYFDRGDPAVGGAAATDGVYSLSTAGWDVFKNRLIVREAELAVPGAVFYGQAHCSVKNEPGNSRDNNMASRVMTFTWNGTSWVGAQTAVPAVLGSVLNRWSGAAISSARNGNDDGHFVVGVKVTGPVNGMWHYEYAVHNQDNRRGGASFRLPICPTARVANAGFRDIDGDALNNWTFNNSGSELAWLAPAGNSHDWNTIFNVWFDSDAAPTGGAMTIDQARIGAGALSVSVPTSVPGLLGTEYLGAGCGAPAPTLFANGVPSSPNPAYALQAQIAGNAFGVLAFASATASAPLGGSCTQFVDGGALLTTVVLQANGAGLATWSLPVPPAMVATDIAAQLFELGNGPILGFLAASNGVRIRAAGVGCP